MDLASHGFAQETLTALAEASAAINSTLELDVVLDQIAVSAAAVMRAEASSVLTYDRRRDKLIFSAAVGTRGKELLGRQFDAKLGIAGRALVSGKAQTSADVSSDVDFYPGIDALSTFHTRNLIAAPMVHREEVIGVIEVLNRLDGGAFGKSDLELLRTFANLAAYAARNAQDHESLKRQNRVLRESLLSDLDIIGSSKAVSAMLELADRVAATNATVLLLGETGTGKELLAKYIHKASPRAQHAFVAVNCAALPETLLESELFGHEKGSFTGAYQQHTGRFELADGGTLFLDEIGEISPSTQVKLLRFLQEREFTRIGGTKTMASDVRILAATNRDLDQAMKEGRFRDDLYYRLNVFPITMPPLRDRREDVAALAEHFVGIACANLGVSLRSLSPQTVGRLTAHQWPGNIRELANVIERAVLMSDGPVLQPTHLAPDIGADTGEGNEPNPDTLWGSERAMIVDALRRCDWNQSKAARTLAISRDNLRYRVKKYSIQRGE